MHGRKSNLLIFVILLSNSNFNGKEKTEPEYLSFGTLFVAASDQKFPPALEDSNLKDGHKDLASLTPLEVDTKYWTRNTELGEHTNWEFGVRPCRLSEKITLGNSADDSMIVALGNSYGPIESNTREILLNSDGTLLLEEDQTFGGSQDYDIDESFLHYLNSEGDCSDKVPEDGYYHFQPHPDDLSWFNPANWHSSLIGDDKWIDFVPESHLIPCTEDMVVFSNKHVAQWSILEGNEQASELSFKVNFRASQTMNSRELGNISQVDNLRISRLIIGKKSYDQYDFERLVRYYGNTLLELGGDYSLLKNGEAFVQGDSVNSPLIIDESSVSFEGTDGLCVDEAGCFCGNENTDTMSIICSFNEPLNFPDDYPCDDPIIVSGYCDKICASNVVIDMNPNKFSEPYVSSLLMKVQDEAQTDGRPIDRVFSGNRRVDFNLYEITFRIVPKDRHDYANIIGEDLKFAKTIKEMLEKPAIKSFYGIRSIKIVASVHWRSGNGLLVFFLGLSIIIPLMTIIYLNENKIISRSFRLLETFTTQMSLRRPESGHWQAANQTISDENILLVESICNAQETIETYPAPFVSTDYPESKIVTDFVEN